jgi:hypothetical protein
VGIKAVTMANTAVDRSASGQLLHLGGVDQVRVRVAYARMIDGPAYEVFFLDLPGDRDNETFDEKPYLEALEPILHVGSDTPLDYSLHVNRSYTSSGSAAGDVEICVNLPICTKPASSVPTALDAVSTAFRRVLDHAGLPEPLQLGHDDAIAWARALVERAYPQVHSDVLWVSEEEHRAAQGAWLVGLCGPKLDRYVVVVGFLDGYVGSAHVRHEPASEVLDSVGLE